MNKRYVDLDEILLAFPKDAEKIINDLPTADVVPVRYGKWKFYRTGWDLLQCTACEAIENCNDYGEYYMHHWNYCPNCGAKMEGVADV